MFASNRFTFSLSAALVLSSLFLACGGDGVSPECVTSEDCSDGVFCNGDEVCDEGSCAAGVPLVLDDGVACTTDSCDEEADAVVHAASDDLCELGESCSVTTGCTPPPDGCAFREAEHPSYTTPSRDVVLCGNRYTPSDIEEACGEGWHVCRVSEWSDRYPAGEWPGGTRSTWGADQAVRCLGNVWEANRPESDAVYTGSVCYDPENLGNASYNPWNGGKYLFADDGTTILEGDGGWGDWDTSFEASDETTQFAVYCCRD